MKKNNADVKLTILFNALIFTGICSRLIFGKAHEPSGIAAAYLDPGTGSMIISAIVGVFATIALGVKTFWYKIINIFKPKSGAQKKSEKSAS